MVAVKGQRLRRYKSLDGWCVTLPNGGELHLNTLEGADTVLGLYETILALEARIHKGEAAKSRKRQAGEAPLEGEI
jgi:hypothetical protein